MENLELNLGAYIILGIIALIVVGFILYGLYKTIGNTSETFGEREKADKCVFGNLNYRLKEIE